MLKCISTLAALFALLPGGVTAAAQDGPRLEFVDESPASVKPSVSTSFVVHNRSSYDGGVTFRFESTTAGQAVRVDSDPAQVLSPYTVSTFALTFEPTTEGDGSIEGFLVAEPPDGTESDGVAVQADTLAVTVGRAAPSLDPTTIEAVSEEASGQATRRLPLGWGQATSGGDVYVWVDGVERADVAAAQAADPATPLPINLTAYLHAESGDTVKLVTVEYDLGRSDGIRIKLRPENEDDVDERGTYTGAITINPGALEEQVVKVTLKSRDHWFWAIVATLLGGAVAFGLTQVDKVLRPRRVVRLTLRRAFEQFERDKGRLADARDQWPYGLDDYFREVRSGGGVTSATDILVALETSTDHDTRVRAEADTTNIVDQVRLWPGAVAAAMALHDALRTLDPYQEDEATALRASSEVVMGRHRDTPPATAAQAQKLIDDLDGQTTAIRVWVRSQPRGAAAEALPGQADAPGRRLPTVRGLPAATTLWAGIRRLDWAAVVATAALATIAYLLTVYDDDYGTNQDYLKAFVAGALTTFVATLQLLPWLRSNLVGKAAT